MTPLETLVPVAVEGAHQLARATAQGASRLARATARAVKTGLDSFFGFDKPAPAPTVLVYPTGFPTTFIAAGSHAMVVFQPEVPFRPERLYIPPSLASKVQVNDIKVGPTSCTASSMGPIPGEVFAEPLNNFKLDTAAVGQKISLNLTNISEEGILFRAGMFGTVVLDDS